MVVVRGCAFVEQLLERTFESEHAIALAAGGLTGRGLAARRGRLRVSSNALPDEALLDAEPERRLPSELATRIIAWVAATNLSHVLVVRSHYSELAATLARALPGVTVGQTQEGGLPCAAFLERWIDGSAQWPRAGDGFVETQHDCRL